MPRVLRTTRLLDKQAVLLERFTGRDAQGRPAYQGAVQILAHVVESGTHHTRAYIVAQDGTRIHTPLALYVEGDAPVLPDLRDRVTVEGTRYIVAEVSRPRGLRRPRSQPDHVRARLRLE